MKHICPVWLAGGLDNRLRRLVQNPRKILFPYLKEGMTALDIGCGPGFFTLDMAVLVGAAGKLFAADLQDEMLDIVRRKVAGTELEQRIVLHKCAETRIGLPEKVDFALAFYMVHEVPDKKAFLAEIHGLLKPGGALLVIEPPFHVSGKAFAAMLDVAREVGFTVHDGPKLCLSRGVLLRNG